MMGLQGFINGMLSEPWEMYRNDLRYDNNDDGKVDEDDFPNWRNPGQ